MRAGIKPRVGISLTLQPVFHLPGEFKKKKKKCVYIYIPEPAVAAGPVCLSCMSVLGLPRPFSPVFFLWLGYFISLRWEDKRHWRRMDHQPATSFLQLSYKCKLWVWVQGSPLKTGRCWIPKLHVLLISVFQTHCCLLDDQKIRNKYFAKQRRHKENSSFP